MQKNVQRAWPHGSLMASHNFLSESGLKASKKKHLTYGEGHVKLHSFVM